MNPLFEREYFIPDGEAHVMPDGRLYVYGSWDKLPFEGYCSSQYTVFSTNDMVHWQNHGVSFDSSIIPWNKGGCLFAPDCVEKNGKYYLLFCMSDGSEGVAESDSPYGPFENPRRIDTGLNGGIDPAVFRDDDGKIYYLWGQFELNGGVLNPDMTLDLNSVQTRIVTEEKDGFHEGSSLRKRNGIYYLVYTCISRGMASCLAYATSNNPLGPYKKQGIIIDNIHCDPSDWNNHGSIECFGDQWYVFYHRTTNDCQSARRLCAEPIFFDENGLISEVPMTINGAEPPILADKTIDASRASRVFGGMYVFSDGKTEYLTGCEKRRWREGWAEFKGIKMPKNAQHCIVVLRGCGRIYAYANDNSGKFACDFNSTEFTEYKFEVSFDADVDTVWFAFDADERADFLSFRFE